MPTPKGPGEPGPTGRSVLARLSGVQGWHLALIGGGQALVAALLGYPDAAWGVTAGTPAGILNHWLTRRALGKWQAGGTGSGWVLGASMVRLAVAFALLWWAAGRGLAFLLGALAGLLVEVVGYVLMAPRYIRQTKAGGR